MTRWRPGGKVWSYPGRRRQIGLTEARTGQSDRQRAPGSIGATSGTARVFKGKRMPGHMGNRRVTSQNLKVVLVDAERNLIGVRGAVPGPKGGLLVIKEARKQ